MKIDATVKIDITPHELGKIAAELDLEEVGAFWLGFSKNLTNEKVNGYAKALSPQLGGMRKGIFEHLYHAMKHHEFLEKQERS